MFHLQALPLLISTWCGGGTCQSNVDFGRWLAAGQDDGATPRRPYQPQPCGNRQLPVQSHLLVSVHVLISAVKSRFMTTSELRLYLRKYTTSIGTKTVVSPFSIHVCSSWNKTTSQLRTVYNSHEGGLNSYGLLYWFILQWNLCIKTALGTNKVWSLHTGNLYMQVH